MNARTFYWIFGGGHLGQPESVGFCFVFLSPRHCKFECRKRNINLVLIYERLKKSYEFLSFRSWTEEVFPHHTTITMFHFWYDVLKVERCVSFTPELTGPVSSKMINFQHYQSAEHYVMSGNLEQSACLYKQQYKR